MLCTIFVLKHSLSPIYWMNVSDTSVPFGGLIEHTNYLCTEVAVMSCQCMANNGLQATADQA